MLNYFGIKPVLTTTKNPQANAPVEQVHQVILNMLFSKDISNKVFDYIDPWGDNLASLSWWIRASYHITIQGTLFLSLFGRDIIYNLASGVD